MDFLRELEQKMLWIEYAIEQAGRNWNVKGDWPGEVMGLDSQGNSKEHYLYKPGDVFRVNDDGWLVKVMDENGATKD